MPFMRCVYKNRLCRRLLAQDVAIQNGELKADENIRFLSRWQRWKGTLRSAWLPWKPCK